MSQIDKRVQGRIKRKRSIRKKVKGTAQRPRLTVFKSLKYIYAQVIDDVSGTTLASASTVSKVIREKLENTNGFKAAELVGETIADEMIRKGVKTIVFDRNGYLYHGKVKCLADKVREKGIKL